MNELQKLSKLICGRRVEMYPQHLDVLRQRKEGYDEAIRFPRNLTSVYTYMYTCFIEFPTHIHGGRQIAYLLSLILRCKNANWAFFMLNRGCVLDQTPIKSNSNIAYIYISDETFSPVVITIMTHAGLIETGPKWKREEYWLLPPIFKGTQICVVVFSRFFDMVSDFHFARVAKRYEKTQPEHI